MLDDLYAKAEKAAGRPVEVQQTNDGMFVVEWFSYGESPPPKGDSVEEALDQFIQRMLTRKVDPVILGTDNPKQEDTV